jgi:hypothetical protein
MRCAGIFGQEGGGASRYGRQRAASMAIFAQRAHATASTPMQFVAFGDIDAIAPDLTNPNLVVESRLMRDGPQSFVQVPPPGDLNRSSADKGAMLLPHPGGAPGTIAIAFGSGLRVSVDSYVNEKALARVLRTLKVIA